MRCVINDRLEDHIYFLSFIATRRNTHRAVVSFEPVDSLKPNEMWKVGHDEKGTTTKKTKKTNSKRKSKSKRVRLSKIDDVEENDAGKSQDMEIE